MTQTIVLKLRDMKLDREYECFIKMPRWRMESLADKDVIEALRTGYRMLDTEILSVQRLETIGNEIGHTEMVMK